MNAPIPLTVYAAATRVLEPLAPILLRRRLARGKEHPERWRERLGFTARSRPTGPLVWLHGASVGESLSLLPLIGALREARPDLALLVTSGTVSSAQVLAQRLPPQVIHQFAPVDAPAAARRFLQRWRPSLAILVESELWPNLILQAATDGVKLALVSARITPKSATGWSRAPASAAALLSRFDLILPQDAPSAARLAALGARPQGLLNLKLAGAPLEADTAALSHLASGIAGRQVVLANSTHPGEDEAIVAAVRAASPGALTILAPRHPKRGAGLATRFNAPRRSAGQPIGPGDIYVADTLGELGLWLRLAEVVIMGGSLVPSIGGHNPMEAARLGCAILTGPHIENARTIYDGLIERAGAISVADSAALERHLRGLLDNPVIAHRTGEAALDFAEAQGPALDAALAALRPLLPA